MRLLLLCVRRCGPDAEASGALSGRPSEEIGALGRVPGADGQGASHLLYGGGTPTTPVRLYQLDRLLARCREVLPLEGAVLSILWVLPDRTPSTGELEVLKRHGVGRISINPQTLEDHVLRAIGRKHAAGDIRAANDLARSVGFDCINMDLISGLPGTPARASAAPWRVLEMEPENITVPHAGPEKGSALMERGGSLPAGRRWRRCWISPGRF